MSATGTTGPAGQASIELLASVPALLLLGLVCFQLLAVGYAAVLADHAAEAAALAAANGRDPRAAAHDALPGWSRSGVRSWRRGDRVLVRVRSLSPLRFLSRRLAITAGASVRRPGRTGVGLP